MELKDFTYQLLAAKDPFHTNETDLRNKSYNAWFQLWDEVYRGSKTDYKLVSDDFLRQDLISCIQHKGEVAALHFYTFFDISCQASLNTKYFEFFNQNYLDTLRAQGVRHVVSMEYFTVTKAYRKAFMGFSLGRAILEMGIHLFTACGTDAVVAPARNDLKVNEISYDVGFTCIEKETQQRGFLCDLIACYQGDQRPCSDPKVVDAADFLWNKREIMPSAQLFLNSIPTYGENQNGRQIKRAA